MKKILISRRTLEFSLLFGLLFAVFASLTNFNAACDDLRQNVLRLHIIANSDDAADQNVKLLVRDKVLEAGADIFEQDCDMEAAILSARKNLDLFEKQANTVLKQNGFNYTAKAYIDYSYFETREYQDFTLPAGRYKSLIIELGEAKGKNWWCVIFPEVCLPAAAEKNARLSDTVSERSAYVAENSDKYVMRFKTVELYEDIKKLFSR